ncbi:MAG: hypothetical protein ACREEY_17215 [Brevundimonas sp.]
MTPARRAPDAAPRLDIVLDVCLVVMLVSSNRQTRILYPKRAPRPAFPKFWDIQAVSMTVSDEEGRLLFRLDLSAVTPSRSDTSID